MFLKGPTSWFAFALLAVCALLEVGGDAIVRLGLHEPYSPLRRGLVLFCGALVLFAYGVAVNTIRWDFGKLLGLYVALFFVVAQVVAWVGFGEKPTLPIVVGGALIVGGGLVIQLWKT